MPKTWVKLRQRGWKVLSSGVKHRIHLRGGKKYPRAAADPGTLVQGSDAQGPGLGDLPGNPIALCP